MPRNRPASSLSRASFAPASRRTLLDALLRAAVFRRGRPGGDRPDPAPLSLDTLESSHLDTMTADDLDTMALES